MIPRSLLMLLTHLYACQIAALPTNTTFPSPASRIIDSPSPKSPALDFKLFGNVYARYFLHALAVVLAGFLVRFICQYVKIHYFPSMPTISAEPVRGASAIGSTLSLGNLEASSDETLQVSTDSGTLQVQLPFPTRPHQVHRPGRHDEEIGVNH